MTFYWIPSHVGIPLNEKADVLARSAAEKDDVDVPGHISIKQMRSRIRQEQYCIDRSRMVREHCYSDTFKHYDKVSDHMLLSPIVETVLKLTLLR